MEWFEVVGQRYGDSLEPPQFFYSMQTRSQRIRHESLRLRDKVWLEGYERWFARKTGVPLNDNERAAADADALSGAGSYAQEPRRRLADDDVLGERWPHQ